MSALIKDHLGSGAVDFGSPPGFAIALGQPIGMDVTSNEILNPFAPSSRGAELCYGFSDMTTRAATGCGWAQESGMEFGSGSFASSVCYIRRLFLGWFPSVSGDIAASACHDAAFSANPAMSALYLGGRCVSKVGQRSMNAAPSTQAFTGVGFQPDIVLTLGGQPFFPNIAFPSISQNDGACFSIGVFDADGNQWAMSGQAILGSGPLFIGGRVGHMVRKSQFREDSCVLALDNTGGFGTTNPAMRASFVSMDPDGFTLDISEGDGTGDFFFLAIKVDVGHGQVKAGTSRSGLTPIAPGFEPDAMLFAQSRNVDASVENNHAWMNVGIATHETQRGMWGGGDAGAFGGFGPNPLMRMDSAHALWDNGVSDATVSLDSGGATLGWSGTDGHAYRIGWIAFQIDDDFTGVPIATTGEPDVTCSAATLHGTVLPNTPGGTTVTAYFEWGETTAYGTTVGLGSSFDGLVGIPVSTVISGLTELTTYHYRLVITQGACVYLGDDVEFTTPACGAGLTGQTERITLPFGTGPITN